MALLEELFLLGIEVSGTESLAVAEIRDGDAFEEVLPEDAGSNQYGFWSSDISAGSERTCPTPTTPLRPSESVVCQIKT